jgi:hypothetical protein
MKSLALVVTLAVVAAPLAAHHSFPAYYFEQQSVTIEGELVEFNYRTPHTWVHVRTRDGEGAVQTFAAEWSSPNRLQREGISKDTLKVGDHVRVTGSPGRIAAEYRLHLKSIERPADGWRWAGGRDRRRR